MFRDRDRTTIEHDEVTTARGGVLFGPIVTGVLVAFGGMFLLSALAAGVLSATGYLDEAASGEILEASLGAGIALVVAQFLAYLWGGYTAGRMSRGAGAANGALVPLAAIVVALIVWGIAAALGATANLNLPFTASRFPVENDLLIEWGPTIGIASLVAMFLGGILGGLMGVRWHTKLERRTIEDVTEHRSDAYKTQQRTDTAEQPEGTEGTETDIRTEDGRPVYVGRENPTSPRTVDLKERESTGSNVDR